MFVFSPWRRQCSSRVTRRCSCRHLCCAIVLISPAENWWVSTNKMHDWEVKNVWEDKEESNHGNLLRYSFTNFTCSNFHLGPQLNQGWKTCTESFLCCKNSSTMTSYVWTQFLPSALGISNHLTHYLIASIGSTLISKDNFGPEAEDFEQRNRAELLELLQKLNLTFPELIEAVSYTWG